MKQVVKKKNESLVFNDGEFIFCNSEMVASKFEVDHNKVVRTITNFITRFEKIKVDPKSTLNLKNPPVFIEKSKEYRGQIFNGYEMNKTAFEHIASKFKTDKAFEWQLKFIDAFAQMESELLRLQTILAANRSNAEWLESRQSGKGVHRCLTDSIKLLVEHALTQGSEHAKMYFTSIPNMINKALFIISPQVKTVRDALDVNQLKHLSTAEYIAETTIQGELAMDAHYKQVYPKVKTKVETFAQKVGRTPVPRIPQLTGPSQQSLLGMEVTG